MELRGLTIQYVKRKARKSWEYIQSLEQCLAEIEEIINNNTDLDGNLESKIRQQEQLKKELQHLYEKRGEGAIFHSKIRWTKHAEKPTRYFFNLEVKNFNQKNISELKPLKGLK